MWKTLSTKVQLTRYTTSLSKARFATGLQINFRCGCHQTSLHLLVLAVHCRAGCLCSISMGARLRGLLTTGTATCSASATLCTVRWITSTESRRGERDQGHRWACSSIMGVTQRLLFLAAWFFNESVRLALAGKLFCAWCLRQSRFTIWSWRNIISGFWSSQCSAVLTTFPLPTSRFAFSMDTMEMDSGQKNITF